MRGKERGNRERGKGEGGGLNFMIVYCWMNQIASGDSGK